MQVVYSDSDHRKQRMEGKVGSGRQKSKGGSISELVMIGGFSLTRDPKRNCVECAS